MSEVRLPALGESVTEGTVTRWLKKIGDTVAIDEPLVEISTDKVDTEIPSPVSGTLQQILVAEDETAAVGAVLAIVADGDAAAAPAASTPPAAEPAPVVTPPPAAAPVVQTPAPTPVVEPATQAPLNLPVFTPQVSTPPAPPVIATPVVSAPSAADNTDAYVTPLVRKLAAETGVNLSTVNGTGVGGRIRREDVLAATSAPAAPSMSSAPAPTAPTAPTAPVSNLRGTAEPMSRLRKVLAERAVASMVSTAQLTTVVEVGVTKIASLRSKVQADFTSKTGVKLNFMPFFFLAAAEALRSHPKINASIDGENIVYHPSENISFAVDTERGLLTPVIRDAATLSLGSIAQQIADLAARTRDNKLKPDELSGGTFTLTNTGSRGALFDTPVVFLPQSAILGTGVVTKRAVVVTDENGQDSIAIRSMVYLALSYDHRLIDGADASRFLVDVKTRLEDANFMGNMGF
jgi:2-oxoglutarate dehydrogenase E2 component (dihydrolipoamide succinyltransferase)